MSLGINDQRLKPLRGLLIFLLLLVSGTVWADLTVLPPAGTNAQSSPQGADYYDYGTVDTTKAKPIQHTFTLRNDGSKPAKILRVDTSCGCTEAVTGGEHPRSLPLTLAPGETLDIQVSINPRYLTIWRATKLVWVYLDGQDDPAATLKMSGLAASRPATASADGGYTPPALPKLHQAVPAFTLIDTRGTIRNLIQYQGKPVVLFFFCGCDWCTQCARLWGKWQHQDSKPGKTPLPQTLIIFSGDSETAATFAKQTGLDLSQTVILPDTSMQVTDLYHADPCPRVFTLDSQGMLIYTNDHKDDAPRKASAQTILTYVLNSLKASSVPVANTVGGHS